MRVTLHWAQEAREDLFEIYVTIGLDNPAAAERVYVAIEDRADLLIANPRLGVRRPEIARGVRALVEGVYLLLYRTFPDTDDGPVDEVEIVRVMHGYRDLSRVF